MDDDELLLELNETCDTPLLRPTVMNPNLTNTTLPASLASVHNENSDSFIIVLTYGLVTVLATSLLPLFGFILYPLRRHHWYGDVLAFFASQTASHVMAMSLLVYLPKSLKHDLHSGNKGDDDRRVAYIQTMCAIFGTFFLCYNLEIFHRESKFVKEKKKWQTVAQALSISDRQASLIDRASADRPDDRSAVEYNAAAVAARATSEGSDDLSEIYDANNSAAPLIFTVAECLLSFIDGVRVGWAMSNTGLLQGIAVAFAIFTEQVPRKFGGVAVLQCSGRLSVGQAISCSMIASCFLVAGFVCGAFICSSLFKVVTPWGYAIALALYLHVALIVLMPHLMRYCILGGPLIRRYRLDRQQQNSPPPIIRHKTTSKSSNNNNNNKRRKNCCPQGAFYLSRLFSVDLGFLIGYSISLILCYYAESLPYMSNF